MVTYGAAGTIVIRGTAAAYFLMRAGPEALAVTSAALIVTGVAGLVLLALVSVRRSQPGRDSSGHGGGDQPSEPLPTPPIGDVDAELFRIMDGERLRRRHAIEERPAMLSADVRPRTGGNARTSAVARRAVFTSASSPSLSTGSRLQTRST